MKEEKLSYTKEEIQELIQWFDGKNLPKDLWVDDCTHLLNTEASIKQLIRVIEGNNYESSQRGYVFLLEKIRKKLNESPEKEEKTDNKVN